MTSYRLCWLFVVSYDDDDDDDDNANDDDDGSVMSSYLPVGCQADRGNTDIGNRRRCFVWLLSIKSALLTGKHYRLPIQLRGSASRFLLKISTREEAPIDYFCVSNRVPQHSSEVAEV